MGGAYKEKNMAWYDRFLGIRERKRKSCSISISRDEGLSVDTRENKNEL